MHLRRVQFVLFAAIVSLVGCRPGQSNENAAPVSSPDYRPLQASARPTVAQVQWLGAKRISNEPGAAQLKAIWNLPESRKLEQQTLDKLSLAPWRWLRRSPDTNAALWLRPLLDDLLADESCLEIRQPANQPAEIVFAIQLDDQRAALWQTNLARVLESLTNIRPDPAPRRSLRLVAQKTSRPQLPGTDPRWEMDRLRGGPGPQRPVGRPGGPAPAGPFPFVDGDGE